MSTADSKLQNIKAQLSKGLAPPQETVRSLLLWFGTSRRGWRVCRQIRSKLKSYGLQTTPDFEYAYINGSVAFTPLQDAEGGSKTQEGIAITDPTYRIGRLEAANVVPTSTKPDATLAEAITLMLTQDFSQLPVMTGEREVKGIISWKTIGSRLALKRTCDHVREAMEPAQEIGIEDSLFSAIAIIAEHDYVLVRGQDKKISGIITASDFNVQFQKLAEPFLLVGEIENGIRQILYGKFNKSELNAVRDPGDEEREVEGVSDLTFGEYLRLVEDDKRWKKLKLAIDRVEFVKRLDRVREIRNDVMHFDPDGLDEMDLYTLREFAQFLRRLRDVGAV